MGQAAPTQRDGRDHLTHAGPDHRGRGRCGTSRTRGDKLLTLEAMKMEHSLVAPFDGRIAVLNATAGAQVHEGALLIKIEPA